MSGATRPTRYVAAPDIVARRVAGEQLLVPVRGSAARIDYLFTCNEVGAFVYGRLDGSRDLETLARAVSEEFEVDETRARRDVEAFLDALLEAGLVRAAAEERP